MKNLKATILLLGLLLITGVAYGQPTKEQQQQAEEAHKKAMEMIKNNPHMQEVQQQMEALQAQQNSEKEKRTAAAEKKHAEDAKQHMQEFYWRNKVASTTKGQFADWQWGDVQIAYYDGTGTRDANMNILIDDYVVVGGIDSNGTVNLNLPQNVTTNRVISNGLFPQMYELTNDQVTFSKPDIPYLWSNFTLEVLQGGKAIGNLYMGDSERATHNLASPSMIKYGDKGYLLYWAYAAEACTATAHKVDTGFSFPDGENTIVLDRDIRIDLNFKAGWNLIKVSVNDNTAQGSRTWFTDLTYTTIAAFPPDGKYYFKHH